MSRHLERLLEIDSLIRNNTRSTNKNIAEALEVSERTVRSDLAFLRDRLNAPLHFTRSQGHHYTNPEWQLPSISLYFVLRVGGVKERSLVTSLQNYLQNCFE
ncbi:HTH domain-containing protein [Aphanizomenon flos-aquae]|uniref:HTH domain-containing protein n=1 Tax=Aphanizomenon flos-aquae TaxID=1176 RepID=UPI000483994C|nr:HTH domain-containing protein [Aphanizomenon flos-aquae]